MFFKKTTLLSVSVAALLASPAFADLSTQDVWSDMQARAETSGGSLAAASINGDTYEGVIYSYQEEDADFKIEMGTITFSQGPKDSVLIDYEDEMVGTIVVEEMSGDFVITNDDFQMAASGKPGSINYDYAANEMAVDFFAVMIEEGREGSFGLQAGMEDIYGSTMMIDEGDHMHAASYSKMGSMVMEFTGGMTMDGMTDVVSGELAVEGMEAEYMAEFSGDAKTFLMSPMVNEEMLDDMDSLKGISLKQDMKYAGMSMSFREEAEGGDFFEYNTGAGTGKFLLEETGLHYKAGVGDVAFKVIPGMMPVEIEATMDALSSKASIPFPAEDFVPNQTSPMDIGFEVDNLELGYEVWALIDPAGMFDHAPISFTTDFSGVLNWGDVEEFDQYEAAVPHSLEIKDVTFDGLGVFANIAGNMIFDGPPSDNFDGLPAPTGEVKVITKGVEELLQRLADAGMMDPGMMFMANGMLQTYTAPDGDYRKADIVFDGKGGMMINEMPLVE